MTPDTLFWIASESKPMTAVAVMMLVDEGKIALDDSIEKYLPEFRSQIDFGPIRFSLPNPLGATGWAQKIAKER